MKRILHFFLVAALFFVGCKKTIPVQSVSVTPASVTITEGDSQTLTATVLPADASNPEVSWSSSNSQVVTVSDGKITAVKPGTATVSATADGMKGSCSVTVVARVYPVTGVTLDASKKELIEGESFTLTATVAPDNASNKSVSWSSSAAGVASVDQNGKVTAVKAGKATITVTTKDGGKTATCQVSVIAKVASVNLNKDKITLTEGQSETLTATVLPENANDKSVSWSSSATDIASVDQNGKVTAVKAGTATITVTTKDGGKTATCQVMVQAATGGNEGYGNGNNYGEGQF